MIITTVFSSPLGELLLGSWGEMLCLCDWVHGKKRKAMDDKIQSLLGSKYILGESSLLQQTKKELTEYFSGERIAFSLPLIPLGTLFQKEVWEGLLAIPYGATITYGEFSSRLGKTSSLRGVAAAIGANPLNILIPCHRVMGVNQRLVGYAGGLWAKRGLLNLENPGWEVQRNLFDQE